MERLSSEVDPARGKAAVGKSAERMRKKVIGDLNEALRNGRQLTVSDAVGDLKDQVRYTLVFSDDQYVAGVERAKALFQDRFDKIKFVNGWDPDNSTYRGTYQGINAAFQDRVTGQVFEVQFHTPRSLRAKGPSHPWYDIVRDSDNPLADRENARRHILDIWKPVIRTRPKFAEAITWE